MTEFGCTLMTELHDPKTLVRNAQLAEAAGFDYAVISDRFHPRTDEQGESAFTWSVLGAVDDRTERVGLMSMVTCPTHRYHPALVAQARLPWEGRSWRRVCRGNPLAPGDPGG